MPDGVVGACVVAGGRSSEAGSGLTDDKSGRFRAEAATPSPCWGSGRAAGSGFGARTGERNAADLDDALVGDDGVHVVERGFAGLESKVDGSLG